MATTKQTAEPVTPAAIRAAAQQEETEAQQLVESLEARVRAGDGSVGHEQIEQARSLARFAQLRAEAAEKQAAELAEKQAADDFAAFLKENLDGFAGSITDEQIDAEITAIVDRLGDLYDRVTERNRYVFALARRGDHTYHTWPRTPADRALIGRNSTAPSVAGFEYRDQRGSVLTVSNLLDRIRDQFRA